MASFDSLTLIDELIAAAEPKIRKRFGAIILQIRNEHSLDELADLIVAGRLDDALSAMEAAAGRLAQTINGVWLNAGEQGLEELGEALGIVVDFNSTNIRAVQAMARNRLELVREFTREQRLATQRALLDGIGRGINPKEQARLFRESIGLTSRQEGYVLNYRRQLEELNPAALRRDLRDGRFDRTFKKALRDGTPLSRDQVDRMVGRYRDRWIKYRSEVIARTESLTAVHDGFEEGIRQSVESGTIDPEKVRRIWNDSGDDRVRDFEDSSTSHRSMHLQERGLEEPFTSGAGNSIRFPGDPLAPPYDRIQCRCRVGTRVSN